MKIIKHNKVISRSIVFGGTILAGLGIWIGVSHAAMPGSSNISANLAANVTPINLNFGPTDTFLTPSNVQNTSLVSQPNTVQNTSLVSQPTAAQAAPVQSAKLRTRGS